MILLLGANGYIAKAFIKEIERRELEYFPVSRCDIDYTKKEAITGLLRQFKPSIVLNCAAYVANPSVDYCENSKCETIRANLVFPTRLMEVCRLFGVALGHISTGCLYNHPDPNESGRTHFEYQETDPAQLTFDTGAGVYVSSKQLAEEVVSQYDQAYCWRVRLPFDEFDYARNLISKLRDYPKVINSCNSISHRGDFVKACLDMIQIKAPYGVYNMTNPGFVWMDRVVDMMKQTICNGREFRFWDPEEFSAICTVPKSNCILDVSKLLSTGVKIRPVEEAVRDALENWVPAEPPGNTTTESKTGECRPQVEPD